MIAPDSSGYWLPAVTDPPQLRSAIRAALDGGALAVQVQGRILGLNVRKLLETAAPPAPFVRGAPPPDPPPMPGAGGDALAKLTICRACDCWSADWRACVLITRSAGTPCVVELHKRMARGAPCPHPVGDKWST